MNILPRCKTDWAILLLFFRDEFGLIKLILDGTQPHGLKFAVQPLTPIADQLGDCVKVFFSRSSIHENVKLGIFSDYYVSLINLGSRDYTFYLAEWIPENASQHTTLNTETFPQILESLPKDRIRTAYLKALQVILGAHKENIRVVEEK